MGQACMSKTTDMVSYLMVFAHETSQDWYNKIVTGKDFSYKSSPMNELDYENDILLEEDDECPFNYEESKIPQILTNDDLKKMKEQDKPR